MTIGIFPSHTMKLWENDRLALKLHIAEITIFLLTFKLWENTICDYVTIGILSSLLRRAFLDHTVRQITVPSPPGPGAAYNSSMKMYEQ